MTGANTTTVDSPMASYEVNTMGLTVGPLHQQLLDYYNEMHEARAHEQFDTVEELELIVPPILEEFEAGECQLTQNPDWLAAKMRAGWFVALGDFETALHFERDGYKHAVAEPETAENRELRARRCSVSASNIADQLWRLGRPEEGLPWAKHSVDLWPSNTVNHLVLAITANHAGMHDQANEILGRLCDIAKASDSHDALSVTMMFEPELRSMVDPCLIDGLLQGMREN